jgi:phosphoserine aminotransferase
MTETPLNSLSKPSHRPSNPCFSSGPCAKRPGWRLEALSEAALGRSHRAPLGKSKLVEVLDRSRKILNLPDDYRIAIVPASDTGAVEMALWSLLGARGLDILAWESFGETWINDVVTQLKLKDIRSFQSHYGKLPNLKAIDFSRDVVFTWNGTTSGVRVKNGEWIPNDRQGLTIIDATSAVFAMEIPWQKADVVTWSWQKVLGGEAAHGMIVLSPRAVERLESYSPPWPIPKIFRMTSEGKLIEGLFKGDTINTPSLLATEDQIDALRWAESIGGLASLIDRSENNLRVISQWVQHSQWASFLAEDPETRSCTAICLIIKDPDFKKLHPSDQKIFIQKITQTLEIEQVAYDIASYRDAPPGLRLWGGATIESQDLQILTTWLDWAYFSIKESMSFQ